MEQLEIGTDYAIHFRGLTDKNGDQKPGHHAYYMGGISWRVVTPLGEKTADSQAMYDAVHQHINSKHAMFGGRIY